MTTKSLIKSSLLKNQKVGVIGAGISGLAFTYYLSKLRPDLRIVVIDELDRPGGYIYSKHKGNGVNFFEKGPRTLRGLSNGSLLILDLLVNLNQQDKILALHSSNVSNKKYILSGGSHDSVSGGSIGTLVQLPDSLSTLFKFLSDPLGRKLPIGLINEFFQPAKKDSEKEETVEEFFDRRFNHDISMNLVSPLIHGIYAGDISKLSVNSIFPILPKYETENTSIIKSIFKNYRNYDKNDMSNHEIKDELLIKYKSIFKDSKLNFKKSKIMLKNFPMIALKDGLQTLPNTIYNELTNNPNIEIKLNTKISRLNSNNNNNENEVEVVTKDSDGNEESIIVNHLRSTINSNKLSNLLVDNKNTQVLNQYLQDLNYSSIILSNVFINKDLLPIHGFGVLVPKTLIKKLNLLGVIFDSEVEKNVKPIFEIKEITNELVNEEDEESEYPQDEGTIDINEINKLNKLSIKVEDQKIIKDKDYTKLTFMFGGSYLFNDPNFIKPSNSKLKQMIMNILENELNIDLNSLKIKGGNSKLHNDIVIENSEVLECIPQYEIGYNELKEKVWEEVNAHNLKISFGGMSFGDGVGVPDCVYNALKDAIKLSGK